MIHNPHDPQVGDMAVLESLNPEVRTLALLQTTKEYTYLTQVGEGESGAGDKRDHYLHPNSIQPGKFTHISLRGS